MAKDRFLVDVRRAPQGRPSSGGDGSGAAAYVIAFFVVMFLIGMCS